MQVSELLELAEVSRNYADQASDQSTKEAFLKEAMPLERRAAALGWTRDGSNQSTPIANITRPELPKSNPRVQG